MENNMKASFQDFKEVVQLYLSAEEELDSIPSPYSAFIWDNPYSDIKNRIVEKCIELAFGVDVKEWLFWFCYDRPIDAQVTIGYNNYLIGDLDDFLNMIEKEYFE
jgi:hypothetical protein